MDSRVSLVTAGLLILGAVMVGYWGLQMSQPTDSGTSEATPEMAAADQVDKPLLEQSMASQVVVVTKDLPLYHTLSNEDLALETVRIVPHNAFSDTKLLIGRRLESPVAAGSWLSNDNFAQGSAIAHMIAPDERAIAITVDEVISVGSHLRPGDFVDVLMHVGGSTGYGVEKNDITQVVLQAVKVLSVGPLLGPTPESLSPAPKDDDAEKTAQNTNTARSVVLAVPATKASHLVLASQAGNLRLAIRSADEKLAQDPIAARQLANQTLPVLRFSGLSGSQLAPIARPPTSATTNRRPPIRKAIEVVRGTETLQQTP